MYRKSHLCMGLVLALFSVPSAWSASDEPCETELEIPQLRVLRFHDAVDTIRPFIAPEKLEPGAVSSTLDEMLKKDVRGYLFRIEGLLRIYDGPFGKSFSKLRQESKEAEDLLGAYGDQVEFLDYAKKMEAPAEVIAVARRHRDEAAKTLQEYLPKLPDFLDRLEEKLDNLKWKTSEEDRGMVVLEIAKELKKREPLDYDLSTLENVHELRRNLRWFLIYLHALQGLIQTQSGSGSLNEYGYLESHPMNEGPFSQLSIKLASSRSISIPRGYFLALSKIVAELGVIKSSGEKTEKLTEGYLESGLAKNKKQARQLAIILQRRNDPDFVENIPAEAKRIRDELNRTQLLRKIRKWLLHEIRV